MQCHQRLKWRANAARCRQRSIAYSEENADERPVTASVTSSLARRSRCCLAIVWFCCSLVALAVAFTAADWRPVMPHVIWPQNDQRVKRPGANGVRLILEAKHLDAHNVSRPAQRSEHRRVPKPNEVILVAP